MKNLYLLPTDKPSRLRYNLSNQLVLIKDTYRVNYDNEVTQHIYITSDEEIKDVRPHNGKWQLEQGQILNKFPVYLTDLSECKLVIMTTDQDLIKDGVQCIDDEFLEWFVNNPSCEEVEVENIILSEGISVGYEIEIPKEEPKQETHICKYCGAETSQPDDECYAKPKTLEEAAETYVKNEPARTFKVISKYSFKAGAEWQQERMYSEEDMIAFAKFSQSDEYELHSVNRGLLSEFNKTQFKKK